MGVLICTVHLTLCSFDITYVFQSKSTVFFYLNFKELLARNRCNILSLSDYNSTGTHNHFIHKWTLNYLAKQTKWLSWVESILSCHVHVWEWIHTLYFADFEETFCSKQMWYLKFKWGQGDSNPQPFFFCLFVFSITSSTQTWIQNKTK